MDPIRDDALLNAMRTVLSALSERLREREDLRQAARELAKWFANELERPARGEAPAAEPPARATAESAPATTTATPQQRTAQPARPTPTPIGRPTVIAPPPTVETTLKIGGTTIEGLRVAGTPEQARLAAEAAAGRAADARDWGAGRDHPDIPDLAVVSRRARLKAEACRWAVERRTRIARDADFLAEIKPTDASLIERARATPDCYLWMLDPRGASAADALLDALAGTYDALALACDIAGEITGESPGAPPARGASGPAAQAIRRDLYWLVAEAQSALRYGVLEAGQRFDRDQMDLFVWLRERTSAERIFVERHMKVEDPADPSRWRDLSERLEGLRKARRGGRSEERRLAELRHKAAYHAQRLAGGGTGNAHDWAQLFQSIEGLLALGVPASNRDIADLLLPLRDAAPPVELEPSPSVRQAFVAAERLAAQLAENESEEGDAEGAREQSPETREAAELLRGKVVVFIGGERRRESQERLERDLELAELRWNTTAPHQSLSVFEPEIVRPDVAVVLLAIRWSSHSYGELQDVCNRYGKILVRLPGGYSTNQVAAQVVAQAGERLRLAAAR